MSAGLSLEIMEAGRKGHSFQALKEKDCYSCILYLVRIFFSNVREIKQFSDEGKLSEIVAGQSTCEGWLDEGSLTRIP